MTLPGGFADVGRSAAENVEKEILEETGLSVTARHLYSVRHKAKQPYGADARDFYKLFFLCERAGSGEPAPGLETSEVGFFSRDRLPELSRGRVTEQDIDCAFAFHAGELRVTAFD